MVYTIALAVFDPLFFIMIYVTYLFYKKNVQLEKRMLTFSQKSAHHHLIDGVLHGIITGLLGSWLMQFIGLPLEVTNACLLLLPIALLLSLKNPRFACFSYAAPILGMMSIVIPRLTLDILGIVSLVGTLHLMEGILVYLTGARGSIPVMVHHRGEYVGAYMMQKYWPIPIALLTPLYGFAPLCGILGFGSIAITSTPEKKARKMGMLIIGYALLLIAGSRVVSSYSNYKFLILLLMPLFHEMIYRIDRSLETNRPAIYTNPSTGIRVFDVLHNSYGDKMGIKKGDIISTMNHSIIENVADYHQLLLIGHHQITLHVLSLNGKKQVLQCSAQGAIITELGIVPLPTYSLITQSV